ncbi:MAG: ketopantoate reductase family protein [Oscillospiraceae bacterium]|jgi:2-dehydropantoate 2-reductase
MRIAILGAGAMGMLFGAYLSKENDVVLIDIDPARVESINRSGITVVEKDGTSNIFRPGAATTSQGIDPVDLIIVFVKSMYSQSALEANRALIGDHTYIMSLQNGSGHEEVLLKFAPENRIILGATQHNSSVGSSVEVHHGGGGHTYIGLLTGETVPLVTIADCFQQCNLDVTVSDHIQMKIWEKMFLNVSASVLTAILQVKLGYILDNKYAWELAERLIREAVAVAVAKGLEFSADAVVKDVQHLLEGAREGWTSIYADIRDGRKTEVDSITGSVIRAAQKLGVPVPTHQCVSHLVHALEGKHTQ